MAVPAGLEPATLCFEGRCSIQLSYGTWIQKFNGDARRCAAACSSHGLRWWACDAGLRRRRDWHFNGRRRHCCHVEFHDAEMDQRSKQQRENECRRERVENAVRERDRVADQVQDENDRRSDQNWLKPAELFEHTRCPLVFLRAGVVARSHGFPSMPFGWFTYVNPIGLA